MNGWSMLMFLGLVLAVSLAIHAFLLRGLVRGLGLRARGPKRVLALVAAALALSYPIARWLEGHAPGWLVLASNTVAAWWLGLMLHLLWIGLLFGLVEALLRLTGLWPRLSRHHARLGRAAVAATVLAAVILTVIGARIARRPATVREVAVPMAGLADGLEDLRIAVAADLHAGVLLGADALAERVEEILALRPDLILLAGDLIDHPVERLRGLQPVFARLRAPLGVYACTGNHEYYVGVEPSVAFLREAGIRVLLNERVAVAEGLVVAGVEDPTARRFGRTVPSFADVLGADAPGRTTLLLNHTPGTDAAKAAVLAGADLVVSGHTHGGQIWPFSFLTRRAFPYHHGLYAVAGAGYQLTTCGLGWWGPPVRLGTVPEILLVRLVPAAAGREAATSLFLN